MVRRPVRITVPNFVKIGLFVIKILQYFIFFICFGHIWTTHKENLVVSITVNLVMIDSVVSII